MFHADSQYRQKALTKLCQAQLQIGYSVSFFWVKLNQIAFGLVLNWFVFSFSFKKLNRFVLGLVLVFKN